MKDPYCRSKLRAALVFKVCYDHPLGFRKAFSWWTVEVVMFTKVLLLKIVLPLLIVVLALWMAPFSWARRLRTRIRLGTVVGRVLIPLLCLGALAYGADYVINKFAYNKEESRIQRQGGRTGVLPVPDHGRPLRSP
ncbi:hypothetical protein [Desulfosoma sp.]|uniref:hypothetical protein n=1 Tax=Desulfosoma sp. TaxID=2603217 RepID=UPI004049C7F4